MESLPFLGVPAPVAGARCRRLAQVAFQNAAAAGVLQASNRFLLDLTHAFTGQIKAFPDFLEGHGMLTIQTEVQANDVAFTWCQGCLLYTSPSPRD